MKDLIEIRWHGRGGQGAKTAALLLADVAFNNGLYVQGFPEYGPERMGAPITAYNRLSRNPIRVHSNIYEPDYVVVVDESLIESVDVTAGIKEGGAIIINSHKSSNELKPLLEEKGYHGHIYTIDARKISIELLANIFRILRCWQPLSKLPALWRKRPFWKICANPTPINLLPSHPLLTAI